MAKAGLFIPTAHPAPVTTPTANPSGSPQPALLQHQQQAELLHQQQHPQQQQQRPTEQLQQQHPSDQHPSDQQQQQQQQQGEGRVLSQQPQAEHQQHHLPELVFFDKVLADVGDSQSLQQSLSTFSGHIRRVRCILQEATPHSLVLLDEVRPPFGGV